MIKAVFKLADTKSVEATLIITMTIGEWQELNGQLQNAYPSWKLSNAIDAVVRKATSSFSEQVDSV